MKLWPNLNNSDEWRQNFEAFRIGHHRKYFSQPTKNLFKNKEKKIRKTVDSVMFALKTFITIVFVLNGQVR